MNTQQSVHRLFHIYCYVRVNVKKVNTVLKLNTIFPIMWLELFYSNTKTPLLFSLTQLNLGLSCNQSNILSYGDQMFPETSLFMLDKIDFLSFFKFLNEFSTLISQSFRLLTYVYLITFFHDTKLHIYTPHHPTLRNKCIYSKIRKFR